MTDEEKENIINKYIDDYMLGKSQLTIDDFNSKSLNKRYAAIRIYAVKKEKAIELGKSTKATPYIYRLNNLLLDNLSNKVLLELKNGLSDALLTIEKKIEDNKKSDEIRKLFKTMELMKEAGLDTTEIEYKIRLNNKNINF